MDFVVWLRSTFGPGLDPLWLIVTNLGSEYALILLMALFYWLVDPVFGRRVGMTLGASFLLNDVLKPLWDTPRPFTVRPGLAGEAAVATAGGAGFPSGHAQHAVVFWGLAAWRLRRRWAWVLAGTLVALVSFSRLALGVHVPADILGGLAAGAVLVAVSLALPRGDEALPLAIRALGGLMVGAMIARVYPELGRSAGVIVGFLLVTPAFVPPRGAARRVAWVLGGLVLVAVAYLGFSVLRRVLGDGLGSFLRYGLLVLVAAEFWPRTMTRLWPEREAATAAGAAVAA